MDEFLLEHEWYIGGIHKKNEPIIKKGTFAYIEWAYFEGMNFPRKIIDGKMEAFETAYDRMKRWYVIPIKERLEAAVRTLRPQYGAHERRKHGLFSKV